MTRRVVGPFNRVEGDLQVTLDVADGRVASAQVTAPMYRGFEQILTGRAPRDALTYVPRICGICSVSQSVAAARALASLAGTRAPPNGVHATNLVLAIENMADHLTHFYLFFMPDFARDAYAARPWHAEAVWRVAAQSGEHARTALAARQRFMTMLGTLAGRWPHTGAIDPGGSSRAIDAAERVRLAARLREFRGFVERQVLGAPLEEVAALADEAALRDWCARAPGTGDLRLFVAIADDLGLARMGRGPGRYLSYGTYPDEHGVAWLPAGVATDGDTAIEPLRAQAIAEDSSRAWLEGGDGRPRHPAQGVTVPQPGKPDAYTWNKAPRLDGRVVETGAIARQRVAGQPLVRDAVSRHGGTVYTRVLARLVELAVVLPRLERWLAAIVPREPFWQSAVLPDQGAGEGLTEAARGALGHWISVRDGRIANYQIVAPTSWNFSPRDAQGTPGALEQALVGTPVADGDAVPVAVQHVVRSFDPCMVCTVH